MKIFNRITLVSMITCAMTLLSCEDYLEKPESTDVNISDVFSTRVNAEPFLWEVYNTCVSVGFPYQWDRYNGMYASMLMAACDEGDVSASWVGANNHNTGNITPGYNGEDNFGVHYKGIRNANIWLANIDKVTDIPDEEKEQMKAEAKVLRAFEFHELMRRYGAIPLVTEVLDANADFDIPRSTYEECVDFIVKSCDEAAAILPNTYPSNYTGRVTKGVALALKARVLLYAASPLHNSDSPFMAMSDELRPLTGYTTYEVSRWQKAVDASKALLDWAEQNDVHLITGLENPADNYRSAVEDIQNPEIIFAAQRHNWYNTLFRNFVLPLGVYDGWYGHGVTFEHASKYYTTDGDTQIWPDEGPRSEFTTKMEEMEPRFQYSVLYSGDTWNDEIGVVNFYKKSDGSWTSNAPVNGVGYMRKFIVKCTSGGGQFNWIMFRLAEFYLNYAEALNEVSPLDQRAFDAINEIRKRAGIPEISPTDERYDTQEEFRQAIRRERAIELAFEEHRFFDVRRWLIAGEDGVMRGKMHGLNLYEQEDGSIIYKKEAFETRVWDDKFYFYPFSQDEIDKGYIVQNPGW